MKCIVPLLAGIVLFSVTVNAEDPAIGKKKTRNVVVKIEPVKEKKYKLIPLDDVDFETVKQMAKPLMSEDSIMTYEKRRHSILVYDYPENIQKIIDMLKVVDRESVNIRIDIDFMEQGNNDRDDVNVDIGYDDGNPHNSIIVENGKIKKVRKIVIDGNRHRGTSTRNTSQFIVTKSGFAASLWVGKTIVDPTWLNNYVTRPETIVIDDGAAVVIDGVDPDIRWANVGASLQVLPHYLDNGMIKVELYPVVTYVDGKGKKQSVKVEKVSTSLVVANGQRINIGGVVGKKRTQYTNLFGPDFFKSTDKGSILDMYLTATVMKKGSSRGYVSPLRRLPR